MCVNLAHHAMDRMHVNSTSRVTSIEPFDEAQQRAEAHDVSVRGHSDRQRAASQQVHDMNISLMNQRNRSKYTAEVGIYYDLV